MNALIFEFPHMPSCGGVAVENGGLIKSQLWSLVPAEKRDEYLQSKNKDTVPVIDLLPLGYSKVLGKGRLPNIPIVVRARWVSKLAEKKITEAGGVVELVA
jgi:large subunit ribosomal protein L27Ae